MAIIVAGGAGFIGVNLIYEFLKKKYRVFVIDNFSNGEKKFIKSLEDSGNIDLVECDLSDIKEAKQAFNFIKDKDVNISELWHLAANSDIPSGVSNPKIDLKDTFMTTFNLLEMSKIFGIKAFYFASSSAVYGDHGIHDIDESTGPMMPISNYGAMKLASEAQCFAANESFLEKLIIYRFPNVVGVPATHGVILDFMNKLKSNPDYLDVLGDGSQKKSYLHVDDLVSGMIYLSEVNLPKNTNPIFNLGPDSDSVLVSWIAEEVVKTVSPKAKIIYGRENRGWIGDVPRFSYKTLKAKRFGWEPKLNSKQSIKKAISEIFNQLK